ncbi:hypothetical protein [Streptomyces sp. RTd22]|uniref:hypothetical protein n=1 Tax=Streptomyces sp. RTd22 TaxID=1841249 RepID=UPI0007C4FF7C|nr:hypothetical protein [Streptomyces sp. RTd22]
MENPIRRRPKPEAKQQERVPGERFTVYFVMTMTVAAILLAFLFDFGNVWALAARLGVPEHVQALVAPAVSLSYLGLMVGQQYLGLRGWSDAELRRPRIWLGLMGVMTYGLNCADAFMRGAIGEGLFDMVMPTLLLIWGEIGPWLMRQVHFARTEFHETPAAESPAAAEPDPQLDELGREVERMRQELLAKDAEHAETVETLTQAIEELRGEMWAKDYEEPEEDRKAGRRPESPLRPTCREFVWNWLEAGKTYADWPAAAWHKELVVNMGAEAPTVEWCRALMRDEFPAIEEQWQAAQKAKAEADQRIEQMEALNA